MMSSVLLFIQSLLQQNCVETATCPLGTNPFTFMLTPLYVTFGPWLYVLFWGMVVFIMAIKSGFQIAGIAGVIIAAIFMTGSELSAADRSVISEPFIIGLILLAVSSGITFWGAWKTRVANQLA